MSGRLVIIFCAGAIVVAAGAIAFLALERPERLADAPPAGPVLAEPAETPRADRPAPEQPTASTAPAAAPAAAAPSTGTIRIESDVPDTSVFVGVPVLRVVRLFRLFRLLRFIPDHAHLGAGIRRAMKASVGVFLGIAIINFIFAMGAEVLFGRDAPELFGNPARACYSMFRIFTIEGWNEIPDAIARHASDGWATFARIYFGVAVLVGGILGLAIGNAVFVDQMMADNHEHVERDVGMVALEVILMRAELAELRAVLEEQRGESRATYRARPDEHCRVDGRCEAAIGD